MIAGGGINAIIRLQSVIAVGNCCWLQLLSPMKMLKSFQRKVITVPACVAWLDGYQTKEKTKAGSESQFNSLMQFLEGISNLHTMSADSIQIQ